MKIRPNHGLGILLALVVIALISMASSGPDGAVGMDPATHERAAAYMDEMEPYFDAEGDDQQISQAEQQAAEEMMAGVIGMMLLNQMAQAAGQQGDDYSEYQSGGDYGGYYDQGGNYEYSGRWGSGSQYSDGSWNHYSDAAGGAVGGTSDGCIYTTFGWSNC